MTATTACCPICNKTVSYRGDILNKHGYEVKFHAHTPTHCWGSFKSTDGLLENYLKQLENWMETTKQEFPSEWLDAAVLRIPPEKLSSPEYQSYRQYKSMLQTQKTLSRKLIPA